jgi:hypothetical protein
MPVLVEAWPDEMFRPPMFASSIGWRLSKASVLHPAYRTECESHFVAIASTASIHFHKAVDALNHTNYGLSTEICLFFWAKTDGSVGQLS